MSRASLLLKAALAAVLMPTAAAAQIPQTFQNLQHFPKDISRETLVQRMREFSFALGVRCQYCHAGGDGISFEGVKFDNDEKTAKQKARQMLRLVDELNGRLLLTVPSRATPAVRVSCMTCHRGSPLPRTLDEELERIIDADGIEAAVKRYRDLRGNTLHLGRYNFGEWSMNELARRLWRDRKLLDAAAAMLTLNAEFYPKSVDIDLMLAEVHAEKGDVSAAIASLKSALQKQPDHPRATQRLAELTKGR